MKVYVLYAVYCNQKRVISVLSDKKSAVKALDDLKKSGTINGKNFGLANSYCYEEFNVDHF